MEAYLNWMARNFRGQMPLQTVVVRKARCPWLLMHQWYMEEETSLQHAAPLCSKVCTN